MTTTNEKRLVATQIDNCRFSYPLSGCVFSNLKGMSKNKLVNYLDGLSQNDFNRAISYHDSCPYKSHLAI